MEANPRWSHIIKLYYRPIKYCYIPTCPWSLRSLLFRVVITVMVLDQHGDDGNDGVDRTLNCRCSGCSVRSLVLSCFYFSSDQFCAFAPYFLTYSWPVWSRPTSSCSVMFHLVLMRPVLCLFLFRGNRPRLSSRMAVIQGRLLPAFPGDKHLGLCQTWLWGEWSSFGSFQ